MHLRFLRVENFRGIPAATLDFDAVTVLIGENDSGKSSILDALAIVLGAGAAGEDTFGFGAHDFRRDAGGPGPGSGPPIRITLGFEESAPGEWSGTAHAPLLPVAAAGPDGRRRLTLLVTARRGTRGGPAQVSWKFLDLSGTPLAGAQSPALLVRLRSLSPVVLLRGGLLLSSRGAARRAGRPAGLADDSRRALEREVEKNYRRITEGDRTISRGEIEAGYAAALALLRDALDRIAVDGSAAREFLEALGREEAAQDPGRPSPAGGAGARRLGLLLLLGAVLEARGEGVLAPGAEPILVIEDIESNLHPMTLASVWQVISGIRWQRILSTYSGQVLSRVPLPSIRRIVRSPEGCRVFRLGEGSLLPDESRRVLYHVRARRGAAFFARSWLLLEGETEFWMLPEIARLMGLDFAVEGVACVEFAQCGIPPLVKLANDLGIPWHLVADGDPAGRDYARQARGFLAGAPEGDRVTQIPERDIEHLMWGAGYDRVFRAAAGPSYRTPRRGEKPAAAIGHAIRRTSKPWLALSVLEAVAEPGSPGVPRTLRRIVETVVRLARAGAPPRRSSGG